MKAALKILTQFMNDEELSTSSKAAVKSAGEEERDLYGRRTAAKSAEERDLLGKRINK